MIEEELREIEKYADEPRVWPTFLPAETIKYHYRLVQYIHILITLVRSLTDLNAVVFGEEEEAP